MFGWFKKPRVQPVDFDAPLSPEADKFLAEATAEFNVKQESLHRDWRFGEEAEWNYDQSTERLSLVFADGAKIEADGQILGSYSTSDGTWEWAWNNPHVSSQVSRDSKSVKAAGDRFAVPYLQLGKIPVPGPEMVSYLCAIGLKASDSAGIYEGEAGPIKVMIMLKNLRRVRKPS
jgi:hypothetical protein